MYRTSMLYVFAFVHSRQIALLYVLYVIIFFQYATHNMINGQKLVEYIACFFRYAHDSIF